MPSCPHKDYCKLFELFTLDAALSIWKIRYCDKEFKICERYRRADAGQPVPETLLPNGKQLTWAPDKKETPT